MDERQDADFPAVTRRRVLIQGAVAGAVAWTVPTVLSSPAAAQGSGARLLYVQRADPAD